MKELPAEYKPHDGGPCPVDPDAFIWPLFRSEADPAKGVRREWGRAWQFDWSHDGEDDDIIAYTLEPQPSRVGALP